MVKLCLSRDWLPNEWRIHAEAFDIDEINCFAKVTNAKGHSVESTIANYAGAIVGDI